jgi:hypothetical protein
MITTCLALIMLLIAVMIWSFIIINNHVKLYITISVLTPIYIFCHLVVFVRSFLKLSNISPNRLLKVAKFINTARVTLIT